MENWIIYACLMLAACLIAVCSSLVVCLLAYRWMQEKTKKSLEFVEGLNERIEALEVYAEAQQKSSDMAARGSAGGQARSEMAAETAQAEKEGKEVLLSKLPLDGKKAALLALVAQHPKVALNVAQKLNRQFGISKFLGMKESDFLQEVAQVAAQAMEKMQEKQVESAAPPAPSHYL